MVSSKNLEYLRILFDSHSKTAAPDMFGFPSDIQNALFEIFTIDSFLAGLVSRIVQGGPIYGEEISNIPTNLLGDDGSSFVFSIKNNPPIDLSKHEEVLNYIVALEKIRKMLLATIDEDKK